MGVLRRLFGGGEQPPDRPLASSWDRRPSWMYDGMEVQLCEDRVGLEVVGEASYQDNLWQAVGGRSAAADRVRVEVYAVLVAEADNPYDPNAVSVWVQGLKVGYLSRDDARRYRPGLLALENKYGKPIALAGAIVGGGIRADGPGRLGLFLDHDPADFGLRSPSPPQPSGSRMWSGLSNAVATDEADDTYDLSWMNDLPADDLRAIKMLRQLLEREADILDRHFMYAHLEALWWAERGLALYAGDCARSEAVEDLQKRAASYRAKLHPQPRPPRAKVQQPEQPEVEVLTCANCGRDFQRARVRGRKPLYCPECRNEAE